MKRLLTSVAVLASILAVVPSTAAANDLFTLDAQATSPGRLVEDAAGNAYVAWTHKSTSTLPDTPMFCKIPVGGGCPAPITLPIPGATSTNDEVAGVFPVLGPGSTVYVVAPRYVENDVVIWTSTNGGQSFGAGTINKGGYSDKSNPTNVFLAGTELLIGAFNPGLGFSTTPAAGGPGAHFEFASPGVGGVATSSLGLDSSGNPVEAYWNLSDPDYSIHFYRYKGTGPLTSESGWEGPGNVANGYETKLSGGASGLFLISQDYPEGGPYPTVVNVRKYTGTGFGPPVTLATDASTDLFAGGAIAQSPDGHIAVAWPGTRSSDQALVMRLFTSTNGGASFTESDVAHLSGYQTGDNAQLTLADSGQGWLTVLDSGGLRMADLTPITPVAPANPPKPSTYKGKNKTVSTAVGSNLLTLTLPQSCLQSQQPFFVGVGKKARRKVRKALRTKMKVLKVTFFFAGKKLKTKKKKPFRLLVEPGPLVSGTTYVVKARVTAQILKHGHKKKVVRTLKGQIKIC